MGVALRSDGAARSADERPALPAGGRSAASRARDEQQRRRALTNGRLPGLRLGRHPAVHGTACQIDKRQAPSPSPQRSERLPCLLFAQPSIPGCATQTGPGPCRNHCVTRWGRLSSDGRCGRLRLVDFASPIARAAGGRHEECDGATHEKWATRCERRPRDP